MKNDQICKDLLHVLDTFENIDKGYLDNFHLHYAENSLLMNTQNLHMANRIFKKFGLLPIDRNKENSIVSSIADDLPF